MPSVSLGRELDENGGGASEPGEYGGGGGGSSEGCGVLGGIFSSMIIMVAL